MATVVATLGTFPGAGATSVVAALGTALGEQRRQVAVVDATPEGSRLGDVLRIADGGEVARALRRTASLADVQGAGPHGLAAFPATADTNWGAVRPDAVGTVYEQLRERYEIVLVDCGSELRPATAPWLGHADEVVLVTDPEVAGVVEETTALASALDVDVRGVVGNRVPPTDVEDALDSLQDSDQPVLAVLPEDPTVGAAAAERESILAHEPDSAIATCAWRLALRVRERDHDDAVVPEGTIPVDDASADDADEPGQETGEAADGDGASGETPGSAPAPGGTGSSPDSGAGAAAPTRDRDAASLFDGDTADGRESADSQREVGEAGRESDAEPGRAATASWADLADDGDGSDAGSDDADRSGGESGDGEEAELSDEEIEAVFKETIERVKRQRRSGEESGSSTDLDG